jgi:GGDEF domain-containing protein
VARLGGDEFVGLLTSPTVDGRWLHPAARRLAGALAEPMRIAGHSVVVTASIGLVPVPGCQHLAETLRRADAAMYRAKANRGQPGRYAPVFDDDFVCHQGTPPPAGAADPDLEEAIYPVRQLVDTTPSVQTGG